MIKLSIDITKRLIRKFNTSSILNSLTLDINIRSENLNISKISLNNFAKPDLNIKNSFKSTFVKNNFTNHKTIFQVNCKNAVMETNQIKEENLMPGFVHITKLKDLYAVSLYQNNTDDKIPILTCDDQITNSMKLIEITPLLLCWTIEKFKNDDENETKNSCSRFLEFKTQQEASDFKLEFERAVQRSLIKPQSMIKRRLFSSINQNSEIPEIINNESKKKFSIFLNQNVNQSSIFTNSQNKKLVIKLDSSNNC
jgi:hypothetical protein